MVTIYVGVNNYPLCQDNTGLCGQGMFWCSWTNAAVLTIYGPYGGCESADSFQKGAINETFCVYILFHYMACI